MFLTKRRAEQCGIDWIWGRIFSLYGLYEPHGRMLPDLINKLRNGEQIKLSDCSQNWDYLDAGDAAEALLSIAEKGRRGEIYNIANGKYAPLRDFVKSIASKYGNEKQIVFGDKANPFISLSPSVEKIFCDTGWKPIIGFMQNYDKLFKE